jgi:hypothetical protein
MPSPAAHDRAISKVELNVKNSAELAARMTAVRAEVALAIREADQAGVPRFKIAKAARLTSRQVDAILMGP